jgi:hypothetical protein
VNGAVNGAMNWAMLAGSLVAILLLAWVAKALGLGGDVRLTRDDALRIAADEGFDPADVIIDRAGIAAIARDAGGQHMLIRRHGVNYVTRMLRHPLDARLDQKFLTIGAGEPMFGRITLDLGDAAPVWAAGLRRIV